MAHKKGQGSTRNGSDSNPQFRGVKRFGGEQVTAGTILVRQCAKISLLWRILQSWFEIEDDISSLSGRRHRAALSLD